MSFGHLGIFSDITNIEPFKPQLSPPEPGLVKLVRAGSKKKGYYPRICPIEAVNTWDKLRTTIKSIFYNSSEDWDVYSSDMCLIKKEHWEGVLATTAVRIFHVEC